MTDTEWLEIIKASGTMDTKIVAMLLNEIRLELKAMREND